MLCHPKRICGECDNCFALSFASHPRAANWSEENSLMPRQISAHTHKLFIFVCEVCNHKFKISPRDVSKGSFCSFCSLPPKRLCDDIDCQRCFQRSFASIEFSQYWALDNEKQPRELFPSSPAKYMFDCTTCGHRFEASLANITAGKHCPFCATPSRALCGDENCSHCFNRSFASHSKSAEWSDLSTTPRQVMLYSNSKYKFRCTDCNHEYSAALNHVSKGSSCPYCSTQGKLLCNDENCQRCFSRSFASHPRAINWSTNNLRSPRQVFLYCNTKFLFVCPSCNNEFSSVCCDVANGKFCGICRNKTEKKFLAWLKQVFPHLEISYQVRYKWCFMSNSRCKMPFDFVIEELKLAIEIQGAQHYTQIRNFQAPELQSERDARKMTLAMEHGYTVVAVLQEPVWADKQDWQTKVAACIKQHDSPTAYTIRMGLPSSRKGFLEQFQSNLKIQADTIPQN